MICGCDSTYVEQRYACILVGSLWLWSRLPGSVCWPNLPDFSLSMTHLDQAHTIAAMAVIGIAVVGIVKLLARR